MECAATWGLGLSIIDWPDWARCLKRFEEQRRDAERDEPPMVSLDIDGCAPTCGDSQPDALLEYAPYADEAANAEYRRSCGIAEREGDVSSNAAADSVSGEGVG